MSAATFYLLQVTGSLSLKIWDVVSLADNHRQLVMLYDQDLFQTLQNVP